MQVEFRKKMSKLSIIFYIILGIISVIIIISHINIVVIQNSDSLRINLAGRQRMLIQKMTKEILQYSIGLTEREEIENTISAFVLTHNSLFGGGNAPIDLNFQIFTELPKMENSETKVQLDKILQLWKPFYEQILLYLSQINSSSLNYIIRNNDIILNEIDTVVYMMQDTGEGNNRHINSILYFIYSISIILFAVLLLNKRKQLKSAVIHIDKLEKILQICSKCKKVRTPDSPSEKKESWVQIESYIEKRSESKFSHGICPTCAEELYGKEDWFDLGDSIDQTDDDK